MLVCSGLCSIPVRMYIMRRITPTSRARPNTRTVTTRVGAIPRCFVFIGGNRSEFSPPLYALTFRERGENRG